MDTYSFLREFADSWFLIAMTAFFLGTILWAFRPGSWDVHKDTADIPFRNETAPDDAPCGKTCANCACASLSDLETNQ